MQTRPVSLRRRVLGSIVGVTTLAVALFAAPLAYALAAGYHSQAVTDLQRDAARVAAVVPDSFGTDGSTVTLPTNLPRYLTVGVYRGDGTRVGFAGPDHSPVAAAAADGHLHDRVEQGLLAVAAPVPSDGETTLAVRVAEPYAMVRNRTLTAWALMAALAAVVIGLATLLARRQTRQITQPLERLTASATALGEGDFTIRAATSGITEADAAGAALQSTARRLGDLLERERAFSADVSHQLRTPLTALLLGLESDLHRPDSDLRTAGERALRRAEQLRDTVDDLLRLARDRHRAGIPLDVPRLLAELVDRWHESFAAAGRRLTVPAAPDLPEVTTNPAAVRQILDVLLDNALAHGAGTARVDVVDLGTGLSIEVGDDGSGLEGDPQAAFARRTGGAGSRDADLDAGHGIGLALARSLAEAEGGRLVVRRAAPRPVFSLLLPVPPLSRSDSRDPARS